MISPPLKGEYCVITQEIEALMCVLQMLLCGLSGVWSWQPITSCPGSWSLLNVCDSFLNAGNKGCCWVWSQMCVFQSGLRNTPLLLHLPVWKALTSSECPQTAGKTTNCHFRDSFTALWWSLSEKRDQKGLPQWESHCEKSQLCFLRLTWSALPRLVHRSSAVNCNLRRESPGGWIYCRTHMYQNKPEKITQPFRNYNNPGVFRSFKKSLSCAVEVRLEQEGGASEATVEPGSFLPVGPPARPVTGGGWAGEPGRRDCCSS